MPNNNRNRVIFQADYLYVGPAGRWPATGQHYSSPTGQPAPGSNNLISGLHRIQDISYGFNLALTDVNQFGELAAIDRIILDQPTVNLQFSYLQANLYNEKTMGFFITSGATPQSAFSNILDKTQDEKNYFILRTDEGLDAIKGGLPTSNDFVYAIGNGFISSFSTEGAVGSFPRCTVGIDALNMEFEGVTSGAVIPAVNPVDGTPITQWTYQLPPALSSPVHLSGISVLRPGDITVSFGTTDGSAGGYGGAKISDLKIQSYNISYDLARDPLLKLGSKYAFSREIRYPANATATITADMGASETGSLVEIINRNQNYDVTVNINHPSIANTTICSYKLKQAKLESQNITTSIGSNASVTFNFGCQISASGDTSKGIFISGWN